MLSGGIASANGTQILAISAGVPISVAGSTYSKGPTSQTSSKFSHLQRSHPRSFEPSSLGGGGGDSTGRRATGSRSKYIEIDKSNLPSLPIYQLLRAFNLQQYTLKLAEKGYGTDIYKLALLTAQGRDDVLTTS